MITWPRYRSDRHFFGGVAYDMICRLSLSFSGWRASSILQRPLSAYLTMDMAGPTSKWSFVTRGRGFGLADSEENRALGYHS